MPFKLGHKATRAKAGFEAQAAVGVGRDVVPVSHGFNELEYHECM